MRLALPLLAALALAACQERAAQPAPPAEAPRPADIDARGNEPFWFIQVRGEHVLLERPDHPPLAAQVAQARVENGRSVWEAVADGTPLRVSAWPEPGCSDGMSELVYPVAAEIVLAGETMRGCGAPAGQLPSGER